MFLFGLQNQLPGLLSCIESCDLGHFQTYIKSCAPYSLLIGLQKLSLVIGLKPMVEFFYGVLQNFLTDRSKVVHIVDPFCYLCFVFVLLYSFVYSLQP